MSDYEQLEVGGYLFLQEEDKNIADKELKKISYLENHLDFNKPYQVLQVYHKAIEERIFKTPIGIEYLKKIQDFLKEKFPEEEIEPIPLYVTYEAKLRERYNVIRPTIKKQEKKKTNGFWVSVFMNIVLIVLVIGMFSIALSSNNPNILNYERALIDKYSAWEEELDQREQEVREKEKKLFLEEN